MFLKKPKNKKGFTLIELIVVVAIIAILLALLVPGILKFIDTARDTAGLANARTIFTSGLAYYTEWVVSGAPNSERLSNTHSGGLPNSVNPKLPEGFATMLADMSGHLKITSVNGKPVSVIWTETETGSKEFKYPITPITEKANPN